MTQHTKWMVSQNVLTAPLSNRRRRREFPFPLNSLTLCFPDSVPLSCVLRLHLNL